MFCIPSFHVWTLLYLASEKRWFHVACEMTGGVAVGPFCVTVTVTVAWCDKVPLDPVTLTRKLGGEIGVVHPAVTVSVAEPDIVMVVGFTMAVRPVGALGVKVTIPLKPPSDVMVIITMLFDAHCWTVIELGLATMVKSWTLTVTWVL